jgi:hypothetical protein
MDRCKKHLEAKLKVITSRVAGSFSPDLTETDIHCCYDCDGLRRTCSSYELARIEPFYIGLAWVKDFYMKVLSFKGLEKGYREKRGRI